MKGPYTDFLAEFTGLHSPVLIKITKFALPAYKDTLLGQYLDTCHYYLLSDAALIIIH
jgi:hypothetical protein